MSLLQRTGVNQKTDHWHPAFRPSGVMTSNVSEVTETDEGVLIRDAPLKVEATSFVLAVICVALALVLASVMFPDEWSLIGP